MNEPNPEEPKKGFHGKTYHPLFLDRPRPDPSYPRSSTNNRFRSSSSAPSSCSSSSIHIVTIIIHIPYPIPVSIPVSTAISIPLPFPFLPPLLLYNSPLRLVSPGVVYSIDTTVCPIDTTVYSINTSMCARVSIPISAISTMHPINIRVWVRSSHNWHSRRRRSPHRRRIPHPIRSRYGRYMPRRCSRRRRRSPKRCTTPCVCIYI